MAATSRQRLCLLLLNMICQRRFKCCYFAMIKLVVPMDRFKDIHSQSIFKCFKGILSNSLKRFSLLNNSEYKILRSREFTKF